MARKKINKTNKINKPKKTSKTFNLTPIVIILVICFAVVSFTIRFLKSSSYFEIKRIISSDQDKLVEIQRVVNVKGKNIFSINPKAFSKKLERKYPEFSRVDVSRDFPDKLKFNFVKRIPIAKFQLSRRYYVIDDEAMILNHSKDSSYQDLTVITGLDIAFKDLKVGQKLKTKNVTFALSLLKDVKDSGTLEQYNVSKLDISNAKKISLFIEDDVRLIMRREDFRGKLDILKTLLGELKSELNEIIYIDLRFKDPAIKKK